MSNTCPDVTSYLQAKKIIYLTGALTICSVSVVHQGDLRSTAWLDLMSMHAPACIPHLLANIFHRPTAAVSKKKKNLLNHKSFNCTSLLKQEKVTNFERFSNTFVTKKKCHVKLSVIWRNIFPDSRYKRPPNIHLISEQIIFPDH